ncbi:MAG: alpha/beta hydrolase [Planctomycetaceae bacterium]
MYILFLHGWHSVTGGVKPTYLKEHGHEVINPELDDDDFDAAVRTAQAEFDQHKPDVIVGSSRGGAIAMNIDSRDTPLVLLCPAWKNWGTVAKLKPNSIILHSRKDDVIPFADSEELVAQSGLPPETLIEVGDDHRLADEEPLKVMVDACFDACVPTWTDKQQEVLEGEWDGLCYSAAMRWITTTTDSEWKVIHGTVYSGEVGRRIEHAWCERGDVVVDLAMPFEVRVIDRHTYYRVIQPEISKTYSAEDALVLSIRNRHHGPWDEYEQLME